MVETKDIVLPDNLKRAMAKEAEAEREKRAKIIAAEGELVASEKLSEAAKVLSSAPVSIQRLKSLFLEAPEQNKE